MLIQTYKYLDIVGKVIFMDIHLFLQCYYCSKKIALLY